MRVLAKAVRMAGICLWAAVLLVGAEVDVDPLSFDRRIAPLLDTLCYPCHNGEKTKGDVNLKQDQDLRQIIDHRATWQIALKKLRASEMPPAKAQVQPSAAERAQLVGFINRTINNLDCAHSADPGAAIARRLTHAEYDNALRDLLGLDLRLSQSFPADGVSFGFDNNGAALTMPPVLAERYYDAATAALDALWSDPQARAHLIGMPPGNGAGEEAAARAIITRVATRAYRHPVEPVHLDRLMTLFRMARRQGLPFADAVRPMLQAVLISPRFLVRIEENRPDELGPYPLGAYDMASRLSFFLWSSPPDDVLLAAAAANHLSRPEELEGQARRMLADPRARALGEHFAGQWLQLRALEGHRPDATAFPEFTPGLKQAMAEEARLVIDEVIMHDHPITELIDADYTYLNGDLARLYGIAGVEGPAMRRVQLADHRRGGLLTMAAVLTFTADPLRSNIPRRGNYLLSAFLGEPPQSPPPVVPPLEDSAGHDAQLTIREMIDLHRRNPDCAACHAKIDPLCIGLENYDAIGRWQDQQAGKTIDASGSLPGGEVFDGSVALKRILLAHRTAFARSMSSQLLIYALGRGLIYPDDCVLDDMLAALERSSYRFSALVVTVVLSFPFTHRRNPDS